MVFLMIIVGWFGGALANFLSDSLPIKRKMVFADCPHCGQQLSIWNYLPWPQSCFKCHGGRVFRSWVVMLLSVVGTGWLWFSQDERMSISLAIIVFLYFLLITIIDIEHRLILHPTSLFGLVIGGIVGVLRHGYLPTIMGGVAGFLTMLGLYYLGMLIYWLISRWRNESPEDLEALGFGDVNLAGVIGLMLGWPGITVGLMMTIFLAGAASLIYLLFRKITGTFQANLAIPYGPFLALSAVILLFR